MKKLEDVKISKINKAVATELGFKTIREAKEAKREFEANRFKITEEEALSGVLEKNSKGVKLERVGKIIRLNYTDFKKMMQKKPTKLENLFQAWNNIENKENYTIGLNLDANCFEIYSINAEKYWDFKKYNNVYDLFKYGSTSNNTTILNLETLNQIVNSKLNYLKNYFEDNTYPENKELTKYYDKQLALINSFNFK